MDLPLERLSFRFHPAVTDVPREAWDALTGDASPFDEHTFLAACEAASAVPAEGAQAHHLVVRVGERPIAALPLYLKADGRGEFIYDWHWYQAAFRAGIPYYPKAVAMSPFTPVVGPRLLVAPGVERAALWPLVAERLEREASRLELGGVHVLFGLEEEAAALEERGYLRRLTFQPQWRNAGYVDFEGFLGRFRSKDRVKIRRERQRLREQGLRFEVRRGAAIEPDDLEVMFALYQGTCAAYGTGSDYLKRRTWERLFAEWRERLVLFLAWRGDERLAAALCVHKGDALYGRYWGAREELSGLYYELTSYAPIALAIAEGWSRFFPGAGNVAYKYSRGMEPCPVHSAHRVADPRLEGALRAHLVEDRAAVAAAIEDQRQRSKLKPAD